MKLKPYPDYKDSGVPWLGEIPVHWEALPFFAVSKPKSEIQQQHRELLSVYLNRGVIKFSDVSEKRTNPTSEDLSKYQAVDPGDFVLNNQQAWRGSVGVSSLKGIVSPAYLVLSLSSTLHPEYANRLFRDQSMVAQYFVSSKGVGSIQRNLYWPHLKRTITIVPTRSEQHAIARFLDHFDARINRLIRAKRKLIALLNEQKQAIIHRAVTRGLDPDVVLRPSGVEWLGDIPAHWEAVRIKYLLKEIDVRSTTGEETLLSLRMIQGLVPHDEHFARPGQAPTLIGYKVVHPGQVVLNRLQANNGLVFASEIHGVVSPDYAVFDPIGDVDLHYLTALFRTPLMKHKFRIESKGLGTGTAGFLRLYTDRFGMIPVALPPREEQTRIMQGLEAELTELHTAISRVEREIDLIREYRTRLIADVVTGKLDVRAAAAGLLEELEGIESESDEEEDGDLDAAADGQWEEETDAP